MAESYYLLAKKILQSSQRNKKDIIKNLLSSLSYFMEDVWTKQISEAKVHKEENTVRKNQTFERFISVSAPESSASIMHPSVLLNGV